jgi:hypothetical protein
MQKVISVNINSKPRPENSPFSEHVFPQLEKLLEDGYKVIGVHQLAPSPSLYCFTITFILEKA